MSCQNLHFHPHPHHHLMGGLLGDLQPPWAYASLLDFLFFFSCQHVREHHGVCQGSLAWTMNLPHMILKVSDQRLTPIDHHEIPAPQEASMGEALNTTMEEEFGEIHNHIPCPSTDALLRHNLLVHVVH